MKIYIWKKASYNYYDQGAILVVAEDLASATDLMVTYGIWKSSQALSTTPDIIIEAADSECSRVEVFPDSGCC